MSLPLCIESSYLGDVCLRVEFVWQHDRYQQVIVLAKRDGLAVPCLQSIEGTAEDVWPVSPPLQNLSVETLSDGRRVALLVGMAGRSHWSASIEPATDSPQLMFDVACRVAAGGGHLGSLYKIANGSDRPARSAGPDAKRVVVRCGDHNIAIVAAGEARCVTHLSQDKSARVVVEPAASEGVVPVRWKYEIRLEE